MSEEPRSPQWVRCAKCQHEWIGMYVPMHIADATRVMKNMTCPMCANNKTVMGIDTPPSSPDYSEGLRRVLLECNVYLSRSDQEAIHSGSWLHREIKTALLGRR